MDKNINNETTLDLELETTSKEVTINQEFKLNYEIITDSEYDDGVVFSSDNEKIATVRDGIIKGIDVGKATITVY